MDGVSEASISSLKYIRACVDEIMRLSPPKAATIPQEVNQGGTEIDGVYVPQGATVGLSVYAMHHDPDIVPDPYAYSPECWLQLPQDRRMRAALCPFLKGPRACPGKIISCFAVQPALFHLVYRHDIRHANGKITRGGHAGLPRLRRCEDEYQSNGWIVGFADGPSIGCGDVPITRRRRCL